MTCILPKSAEMPWAWGPFLETEGHEIPTAGGMEWGTWKMLSSAHQAADKRNTANPGECEDLQRRTQYQHCFCRCCVGRRIFFLGERERACARAKGWRVSFCFQSPSQTGPAFLLTSNSARSVFSNITSTLGTYPQLQRPGHLELERPRR